MHHLLKLFAGDFLLARIGFFIDEPSLLDNVAGAEEQHAFAGQSVAARAAGFLVVALDVFRQVVVDHEADVRLVDPHAEGDGRADHADVVAQKQLLMLAAFLGRQARMIRAGLNAIGAKEFSQFFGAVTTLTIHNAAVMRSRPQKLQDLGRRLGFCHHPVGEIGPVETGDVTFGIAQAQLRQDIGAHPMGGCRRQRHHRRLR